VTSGARPTTPRGTKRYRNWIGTEINELRLQGSSNRSTKSQKQGDQKNFVTVETSLVDSATVGTLILQKESGKKNLKTR